MAELIARVQRLWGRRSAGRLVAPSVLLIALGALLSASPALAAQAAAQPPVVPSAFLLQGTNDYSIVVFALQARGGRPATVEITARKGRMSVTYSAPATVTETSIAADLGALGQISVNFQPNGQLITRPFKCARQKIVEVAGSYEGVVSFHGEEAYTDVEATSVPADLRLELGAACGFVTSGGGGSPSLPSAELYVRNPGLGPRFSVVKAAPKSPARFFVEDSEYDAGISINRYASLTMPAASFRYGANLQTATVHPPAPFSGTARFDRRKKANRRWSGDLAVDLPGVAKAPLTGPLLRAGLMHSASMRSGR